MKRILFALFFLTTASAFAQEKPKHIAKDDTTVAVQPLRDNLKSQIAQYEAAVQSMKTLQNFLESVTSDSVKMKKSALMPRQ